MGCDTCPLTYPECGRKRRALPGSFCTTQQRAEHGLIPSQKESDKHE